MRRPGLLGAPEALVDDVDTQRRQFRLPGILVLFRVALAGVFAFEVFDQFRSKAVGWFVPIFFSRNVTFTTLS